MGEVPPYAYPRLSGGVQPLISEVPLHRRVLRNRDNVESRTRPMVLRYMHGGLQGYLAHEEQQPPAGPPQGSRDTSSPSAGSWGTQFLKSEVSL